MGDGDVAEALRLHRWLLLGHSGAGKTTLATELGELLKLPVVHLDKLSWRPGWQELDRATFSERTCAAAAGERWIIDGNYTGTLDLRLPRAQAVVWLDYPLWRCLWGVGRRIATWRGRATSRARRAEVISALRIR